MTSTTYVYTYIAFAFVYLLSSLTLSLQAYRASGGMSKAGGGASPDATPQMDLAREYVDHGQRLIDLAQLATLLPLAYIVGSIFLGSTILRDQDLAGLINAVWIVITLIAMGAAVLLMTKGIKESRALSEIDTDSAIAGQRTADVAHKLASRLGISTTLLVLVSVFTVLNLWSVISNLSTLINLDYVL